ncbi:urotensin-2 [Echinops telfairi]|uniref:Urotensin-2 n=1 Tax=Echinops telfairi TaxID=9371 RepID=A0AC55DSI0_ECHTE|nr:urotensin-2 [Echinops telfairi]
MYQWASCWLFIGFLTPLFSLPVTDFREVSPQLSATDEDARWTSSEVQRASLLRMLPEMLNAQRAAGLGTPGEEIKPRTSSFRSGGTTRNALSGQDPKVLLRDLLVGTRKPSKKYETPSECFWKYCI